jgi:hypothetical protein
MTFLHQTIFDISSRQLRSLCEIPAIPTLYPSFMLTHLPVPQDLSPDETSSTPLHFLGTFTSDPSLACAIADGLVDPTTKLPFNLPDPLDLSCFTRGLLSRSQSTPSVSSTPPLITPKTVTKPTVKETVPSEKLSAVSSTNTKASSAKKASLGGGQKNLRDFFGAVSKVPKEKKSETVMSVSGVTVLDRSQTCPAVNLSKNSSSTLSGRHSTSPFQTLREKVKVSVIDTLVQSASKRQRKSYPLLSTKVSIRLSLSSHHSLLSSLSLSGITPSAL